MTQANYCVSNARTKANDPTGVRITDARALGWINDAQREIVAAIPTAYTVTSTVTPMATTRQTMAGLSIADAMQFVGVGANISAAGAIGNEVTKRDRDWMATYRPSWRSDTDTESVHYVYDEREPDVFFLWPAVSGGARVEVIHSQRPPIITDLSQSLALADTYLGPIEAFILYSHYSTINGADYNPANANQALTVFNMMLSTRSGKLQAADATATAKSRSSV